MRSVASALKAELLGISESLARNADNLDEPQGDFVAPDIARSVRVTPVLLPKLGLLDAETVRSVIDIYVSIDQYCESIIMSGGTISPNNRSDRGLLSMPIASTSHMAKINRDLVGMLKPVIDRLDIK
jgi:hypothetical protein